MSRPIEVYACLYAWQFSAQALLRLRPELHDTPCVVMAGEPPLQRVCSFNGKALALGLARGMTRVEVESFHRVSILSRSQREEASTRSILLECAGAFSPRVEDRNGEDAFLCVLDITGTEKLFGPPETLARKLLARVEALGIAACIAISGNFHAAIALARGMCGKAAVKFVPAGEERAALAPLPLTVLDLTEEQSENFALWGIGNLGMLAALPEKELIARTGQAGKRLRQLARGESPHLFQPLEPAFALEEHMELESPVELLDSLLFPVGVMLEQIILRAKARILSVASVTLTLHLDGGTTYTRTIRPALPTNEKHIWLKLLHLDLDAHPPRKAILALSITAEPGCTGKVQLGLFSPQLPEPARLDVTLARIRAIVGDENVGCAVLKDTHEPGEFRMEPFVLSGSPAEASLPPPRPAIRRLRPMEIVPVTMREKHPISFVFRDERYAVEHAYGPWLLSGNWWQPEPWAQEQWDLVARAEGGVLICCIVLDRMRNQWKMAALYD